MLLARSACAAGSETANESTPTTCAARRRSRSPPSACSPPAADPKGSQPPPKLEAVAFVAQVNTDLVDLAREANAAGWTQQTVHHPDTQYLNARVTDHYLEYFSRTAAAAAKYDKAKDKLDASTERSLPAHQTRRERAGAVGSRQACRARESQHRARRHVRRRQVLPAGHQQGRQEDRLQESR